jgi:hypothetical protein
MTDTPAPKRNALVAMFMDAKDGGVDEIVIAIAAFVIVALGMTLYTHLVSTEPVLVNGIVYQVHPRFDINNFGEGMGKIGVSAGIWQALRGGMRAFANRQQPQPSDYERQS